MLVRVSLGAPGVAYVRRSLADSKTALAGFLLDLPPNGTAFTFAPPGTSLDLLLRFDEDLKWMQGTEDPALDLMLAYLTQEPGRYCIFDDVNLTPGDRALDYFAPQLVALGDEYYHVVTSQAASRKLIEQLDSDTSGCWPSNVILAGGQNAPALHLPWVVTENELRSLAFATDCVLAKAYDHLGYVVWIPRS